MYVGAALLLIKFHGWLYLGTVTELLTIGCSELGSYAECGMRIMIIMDPITAIIFHCRRYVTCRTPNAFLGCYLITLRAS